MSYTAEQRKKCPALQLHTETTHQLLCRAKRLTKFLHFSFQMTARSLQQTYNFLPKNNTVYYAQHGCFQLAISSGNRVGSINWRPPRRRNRPHNPYADIGLPTLICQGHQPAAALGKMRAKRVTKLV